MTVCPRCGHDRRLLVELKVCDRCGHAARALQEELRYADKLWPRSISKREMKNAVLKTGLDNDGNAA